MFENEPFREATEEEIEKLMSSFADKNPDKDTKKHDHLSDNLSNDSTSSVEETDSLNRRGKTSLRMLYEAEAAVIIKKIGPLEDVRQRLGLSRRKISQLLMVDPSAWTRWTTGETPPPPHIVRSLQWYLALIKEQPEWHPRMMFNSSGMITKKQLEELKQKLKEELSSESSTHSLLGPTRFEQYKDKEISRLNKLVKDAQVAQWRWKILLFINSALLLILLWHLIK